jgi:hypothetical protein
MLDYLTGFAQTHDSHFVHQMNSISCSCKDAWGREINAFTLPERVINGYKAMSNRFMGVTWWKSHAEEIEQLVRLDWQEGGENIAV